VDAGATSVIAEASTGRTDSDDGLAISAPCASTCPNICHNGLHGA
jgi:hypothetical protein